MRRRPFAILAALAGLLLVPAGAHADVGRFIPATAVDASAGIVALGDLDLARDGTGAVAYVKQDGGVDHIFVSRLVGGAWQAPERIDGALTTPGSQPVVAAAEGGRLAIAFISGGALLTVVRPAADQAFSPPQLIASSASDPAIDLSINDVSYVSFTAPGAGGHDVLVARKERAATGFTVVPSALDIDPNRDAGAGGGRSKVAVAADGVAIVVWGEAGHVFARRVFEQRLSVAPQDATADVVDGHAGVSADLPDVDVQDDSSFAWVVFREGFDDGILHAVGRRLLGSSFDPPVLLDGQGIPGAASVASAPRVDVSGRGDGYVASATSFTAFGAVLKDRAVHPGIGLGSALGSAATPAPAADENGDGLVAWVAGDSTVHARAYTNVRASRNVQPPQADTVLSGGAADGTAGFDASADRAGDVAIAVAQGPAGARSIAVASFDRAPGSFRLSSASSFRNLAAVPLRWSASFELWGPVTYAVQVDGRTIGTTTKTEFAVPNAPNGAHRWRVVATDIRGQTAATPTRLVRQDGAPPRATVTVSGTRRRGRPVRVAVRASDVGSGVGRVRIAFGDGAQVDARRATHSYGRGRFTIRVSVRDRAGNAVVVRRRITIR